MKKQNAKIKKIKTKVVNQQKVAKAKQTVKSLVKNNKTRTIVVKS